MSKRNQLSYTSIAILLALTVLLAQSMLVKADDDHDDDHDDDDDRRSRRLVGWCPWLSWTCETHRQAVAGAGQERAECRLRRQRYCCNTKRPKLASSCPGPPGSSVPDASLGSEQWANSSYWMGLQCSGVNATVSASDRTYNACGTAFPSYDGSQGPSSWCPWQYWSVWAHATDCVCLRMRERTRRCGCPPADTGGSAAAAGSSAATCSANSSDPGAVERYEGSYDCEDENDACEYFTKRDRRRRIIIVIVVCSIVALLVIAAIVATVVLRRQGNRRAAVASLEAKLPPPDMIKHPAPEMVTEKGWLADEKGKEFPPAYSSQPQLPRDADSSSQQPTPPAYFSRSGSEAANGWHAAA